MSLPTTHKPGRTAGQPSAILRAASLAAALFLLVPRAYSFAELTPETEQAFRKYVALSEANMHGAGPFLWLDSQPNGRAAVRAGHDLLAAQKTLDAGHPVAVPNGLIQHWLGAAFISNTTIPRVRAAMQDYPHYPELFAPEIVASKIVHQDGPRYQVYLRLYKKQILTVVLNSDYDIEYSSPAAHRLRIDSRSTRIAEVSSPGAPNESEAPPGRGFGFLWRLNSYWRFEEADGGVYAECEAISLSRDVPLGLFMLRKFIERFPRESMANTLQGVRRAIRAK